MSIRASSSCPLAAPPIRRSSWPVRLQLDHEPRVGKPAARQHRQRRGAGFRREVRGPQARHPAQLQRLERQRQLPGPAGVAAPKLALAEQLRAVERDARTLQQQALGRPVQDRIERAEGQEAAGRKPHPPAARRLQADGEAHRRARCLEADVELERQLGIEHREWRGLGRQGSQLGRTQQRQVHAQGSAARTRPCHAGHMHRHPHRPCSQLRLAVALDASLRQAAEIELQALQGPVALSHALDAQPPLHDADSAQRRVAGAVIGGPQQVGEQGGRGARAGRRVGAIEAAQVEGELAIGVAAQQQVRALQLDRRGREDAAQQGAHREGHRGIGQLGQHLAPLAAQRDVLEAQPQWRLAAQAAPGDGHPADAQAARRVRAVQLRLDQARQNAEFQRALRQAPHQRRAPEAEQQRQRHQQRQQRMRPAVRGLTVLHARPFPGTA
jgi:hypothetical protein